MVEVTSISGGRILVRFRGEVEAHEAVDAAHRFIALLGKQTGVAVWFDVRDVIAYPSDAREAWQKAVVPYREQLTEIGVASRSAITRLGGTMFAMVLGLPYRHLTDADLATVVG